MKRNQTSQNNRFYTTLIKNYILFTLSTILIIIIVSSIGIFKLTGFLSLSDENISSQIPLLERGQYEKIDISSIEKEEGWIEILDKNYKVIYAKGNVKEKRNSYTKTELEAITAPETLPYHTSKQEFKSDTGENLILLSKIPTEKSNIETTNNFKSSISQLFDIFLALYVVNIMLFVLWLNKKVKKPLDKINNAMTFFTESNEETYLNYKGEAEFAQICNSFNIMVKRLKTVEKEKKVIEESKQKMLADISHDLKTPITTIQGYAKAISEGYVTNTDDINKYLNIIYQKSTKVTDLINLLFEYVKLGHPDFKLNLVIEDLTEFIREIIAENYEYIDDKGFILEFDIPDKVLPFYLDKNQLKRAFYNLISNSIKYNTPGTTIKIILEDDDNDYRIIVSDNGTGIPEEIVNDIFVPFVVGDEARTTNSGTGLGLSITKQIIEKHGGKINLLSPRDSEYKTQFEIRVPKPKN